MWNQCSFLLVLASTLENCHLFVPYNNTEFTNLHFTFNGQLQFIFLVLKPWPHVLHLFRFKNGQGSGLDGGQYRVYINGTLEIKQARVEDEGTYTCVANSILGTAENQVHLEVKGQTLYITALRCIWSLKVVVLHLLYEGMIWCHAMNVQHDIKCISNSIFYGAGWYLLLYTSTTYQDNNVK